MPKIEIVGQGEFEVRPGTNVLRFLQQQGYDNKLAASCDGAGMCSTCACRVSSGGGKPNDNELDVLSEDQLEDNWRLTCQIDVQEDVQVIVPGYEPPEALDIEPDLLSQVLNYSAVNLALRAISARRKISSKRLRDLALRASVVVAGEVDGQDFQLLADLFNHIVHTPEVLSDVGRQFDLDEDKLRKLLKAFEDRIPEPEEEILMYPYYLYIVASIGFFLLVGLSAYSLVVDAPLEEPATPSFTPNPEKAPWYFLGIQELLADSPSLGGPFTSVAVGGIIIPGLFVLFMMAMPYLEPKLEFWRKDKSAPPGPRLKDRPVTSFIFFSLMAAFVGLIIIGVYFRGPGWGWVTPWS